MTVLINEPIHLAKDRHSREGRKPMLYQIPVFTGMTVLINMPIHLAKDRHSRAGGKPMLSLACEIVQNLTSAFLLI